MNAFYDPCATATEACPQCGDDASLTFPSAQPGAPDYCEYECHSCANQFTLPRLVSECGRCGTTENVSIQTWCSECGPVALCSQCNAWHEDDMAEELP